MINSCGSVHTITVEKKKNISENTPCRNPGNGGQGILAISPARVSGQHPAKLSIVRLQYKASEIKNKTNNDANNQRRRKGMCMYCTVKDVA